MLQGCPTPVKSNQQGADLITRSQSYQSLRSRGSTFASSMNFPRAYPIEAAAFSFS
jgi:hypothetical protein